MSVFKFTLNVISNFKRYIFWLVFINIWWAIDLSLRPYLIKVMLDDVGIQKIGIFNKELAIIISLYLAISASMTFVWRIYDWCTLKFFPPLKQAIGLKLMDRMMDHSHTFYQGHFVGSLTNRINDVMKGIPKLIRIFIEKFIAHSAAACIAIYTFWQVKPIFAAALAIWLAVFFIGTIKMSFTAQDLSHDVALAQSGIVGYIVDILGNMISVRFFGAKYFEHKILSTRLGKVVSLEQRRDIFFMLMYTFQGMSFVIFQGFCLWWLFKGVQAGTITAGDFALILSLSISIVDNMWGFGHDIGDFAALLGEVKQGLKIAHTTFEITDAANAPDLKVTKGKIEFRNVDFHYKGANPLFNNLNLTIEAGQKVGLVGYSGGGKSTFVNLILRLFDVSSGEILIDDQSINNVSQVSLRKGISIIPQEPILFHRSLMENIRYANTSATDAEVIEAARKACVHNFISEMPQGYNTQVGERGVKLSGGQRQRIAIARAILKNAPILILDEATSQLDSLTEDYIQNSLWELMKGKTALVVAHRLSTLLNMDRILVFEHGRVVEDGTHKQLLKKNGLYKALWDAQVGGFLPENNKPTIEEETPSSTHH